MAINKVYISEVPPVVLKNPGKDGTSGTSGLDGTFFGSSGTSGIDGTFFGTSGTSGITGASGTNGGSVAPNFDTEPNSPVSGALYFNTTDFHFYGWNGGQWKQLDN